MFSVPYVCAIAISTPFISNNQLDLDGKTYTYDVTFQNVGIEKTNVILEVTHGMDWTNPDRIEVAVDPGQIDKMEIIKIKAPFFKTEEEIQYDVYENNGGVSGKITKRLNVMDKSLIHRIGPYSLIIGTLGILISLAILYIYSERRGAA